LGFQDFCDAGFEVFDDVRSTDIGIGKIVGLFEAFVPEAKDVEARKDFQFLIRLELEFLSFCFLFT